MAVILLFLFDGSWGGAAAPASRRTPARWVRIALDHDVQFRTVEAVLAVNDNCKRGWRGKLLAPPAAACAADGGGARSRLETQHRRYVRGIVDPAGDRITRHGREGGAHDRVGIE